MDRAYCRKITFTEAHPGRTWGYSDRVMNMDEPRYHAPLWAKWSSGLVLSHPLTSGTQRLEGAVEMT